MSPDPEQIGLGAKIGGMIVGAGTIFMGWIGLRNRASDKLDARFKKHDDANEAQVKVLREELEKRRLGEREIFRQLGPEGAILQAIGSLRDQTVRFQTDVLRDIGSRPTRDEVVRLISREAKG